MTNPKYSHQRERKVAPHVSLADLRAVAGLTINQVRERIRQEFPELNPTRGAISAIEQGHRGASERMLSALCAAYGLADGAITTTYQPRRRSASAA